MNTTPYCQHDFNCKYNVFISYANSETDIVENLREQFKNFGILAWVYSRDRTLGEDIWNEIKEKITKSNVIIFVVSDNTPNASGQQKELDLALEKIPVADTSQIIPLFITGTDPKNYPEVLRSKNGDFLDAYTVKTVACKIAKHAFPSLAKKKSKEPWNYPRPGMWLVVSNLDGIVEQYFNIGDKLYFRAVSPIGLFECYAPSIRSLFWIAPEHVQPSLEIDNDRDLEKSIPNEYTINGMTDMQILGWNAWHDSHHKDE